MPADGRTEPERRVAAIAEIVRALIADTGAGASKDSKEKWIRCQPERVEKLDSSQARAVEIAETHRTHRGGTG